MEFTAADVTRIPADAATAQPAPSIHPPNVAEAPAPAPAAPAPSQGQRVEVSMQDSTPVYRFVDAKSGDLVLQVPPEEVLRVVRNIQQMLQNAQAAHSLDLKL
jgi:hypothetical protein